MNPNDERQQSSRGTLRGLGCLLVVAGGAFLIVGMVDFFRSFGTFEPPTLFWCCFVGIPMLGIGGALLKFGFMGAVTRYMANEVAPVGKDVVNYMVDGTEGSIRKVASAVGEGLGLKAGGTQRVVRCHKCNADNDADAKFCDRCGAALSKSVPCPDCDELNDPDAQFCDHCGKSLR
jgi:ribosomal protein L40E